jgi:hypothetical protein
MSQLVSRIKLITQPYRYGGDNVAFGLPYTYGVRSQMASDIGNAVERQSVTKRSTAALA